jgi:hypothetical protein
MKICIDGIIREMTEEEKLQMNEMPEIPYKERVISRIRSVYSIDDELAILRQRDTKKEEFDTYNSFVEQIKQEEKQKSK